MSVRDMLKWFNQKTGNFFGDFKYERELEKDPGDGLCRAITRFVCLLCLLGVFGYAFYRLFGEAPNLEVKRVYLQTTNTNYAIERLYNNSAIYGTGNWRPLNANGQNIHNPGAGNDSGPATAALHDEVLDIHCPCTTTTISWTKFVHFYVINSTTKDQRPIMDYGNHRGWESLRLNWDGHQSRSSNWSNLDKLSRSDHIRSSSICRRISLWPERFTYINQFPNGTELPRTPSSNQTRRSRNKDCADMIRRFFTKHVTSYGDLQDDPRDSYFESPSLLNQKFLYSNTIRRLRAYLQEQYTLLNAIRPPEGENVTHRQMFLAGMVELWLYPLQTFDMNSSSTDYDFFSFAGKTSSKRLIGVHTINYPEPFAVVLYEGQSFLGMHINWTEYYNTCRPAICDETRKSTDFHRAYTALAVVGGLSGIAVAVVTLLVYPLIAYLLVRFSRCCSWMLQRLYQKFQQPLDSSLLELFTLKFPSTSTIRNWRGAPRCFRRSS